MVRESGLVGTSTTDVHAAAFATGYGGPVWQGHRGVTTVPTDHQGIGSGSILEAPRQKRGFLIAGVKSASENRPVGRRIGNP
jgi:hypothetical protein